MSDPHQLGPLLKRSRAGDPAALNALLERVRPWVRLLVRPRVRPGLDASDVVQEVLLRVFQGFGSFVGPGVPQFLAWVRRIASNVLADLPPLRPDFGDPPEPAGSSSDWTDEHLAELAPALERLPESYRMVLEARFFDGLRFAEIARRTGRSEGALRVLCLRALERLRREMGANA
jgi:RNA polymerase sigma-70 factor (ECF subfamily)